VYEREEKYKCVREKRRNMMLKAREGGVGEGEREYMCMCVCV
jgi:hypothetical protein